MNGINVFTLLFSKVFYEYNDMSNLLYRLLNYKYISGSFTEYLNYLLESTDSIDFLSKIILYSFFWFFSYPLAYYLLILFYFILSLFFSYKMFKLLSPSTHFSILFAMFFSTNMLFIYRVISFTPNLLSVFVFPMFVYFLVKEKSPIFIGVLNGLTMSLSSYFGYFSFVLIILYYVYHGLVFRNVKSKFKTLLVFIVSFSVVLFLANYQLVIPNSLNSNSVTDLSKNIVNRPIEDYYNFSFRPWYLIVPPTSSHYFGELSKDFYSWLSSSDYYLAQNYAESEASAAYISPIYFLLTLVGIYFAFRNFKHLSHKDKYIIVFALIIGTLLFINLPPSINFKGVSINTPSLLIYEFVPFFRVLVRWGVVIYLLCLIISFFVVVRFFKLLKNNYLKVFFVSIIVLLHFIFFSVDLPVVDLTDIPNHFKYLQDTKNDANLVFLPELTYYDVFWASIIGRQISNKPFIGYTYKDLYLIVDVNKIPDVDKLMLNNYLESNFQKVRDFDTRSIYYIESDYDN